MEHNRMTENLTEVQRAALLRLKTPEELRSYAQRVDLGLSEKEKESLSDPGTRHDGDMDSH